MRKVKRIQGMRPHACFGYTLHACWNLWEALSLLLPRSLKSVRGITLVLPTRFEISGRHHPRVSQAQRGAWEGHASRVGGARPVAGRHTYQAC